MRKFKRDLIRAVAERKKVKSSKYVNTVWNKIQISLVGFRRRERNKAISTTKKHCWKMRIASINF